MTFKKLRGILTLLILYRSLTLDRQVDGELSAATLYGSIRHRPQYIRHPGCHALFTVISPYQQSVGGAAFLSELQA